LYCQTEQKGSIKAPKKIKMKPLKILLSVSILFLFSFVYWTTPEVNYKITEDFTMKVKGTSNVHDWESNVEELKGVGSFSYAEDGSIQIDKCEVSIPVNAIKSTKGSIMDKKTWKALDYSDNPTITYKLTKFGPVNKTKDGFSANATGRLTIAGSTRTVTMNILGKELASENIEITGSKMLKMTDFGIDPPTALLGTMTTGDEVTIEFRIVMDRE
jgi:hypothetical protein